MVDKTAVLFEFITISIQQKLAVDTDNDSE